MIEFLRVVIKTFSNGENSESNICRAILFIFGGSFSLIYIISFRVTIFGLTKWPSRLSAVKIKLILSCRTNYITKR